MGQSTEDFLLINSNMKMFVVLALAALAAAEPEADPQLLLGGIHGVHTPYTHVAPVSTYSSPLLKTLVPAVKTVVPVVKTVAATPVVSTYGSTYGVGYPITYGAIAAPKAVITNYQDSEHYTAEATPLGKALGDPSYVAKNGEVVHEVQKREAEADPALFYSGLTHTPTVYNTGVVRPITYASSAIRPISYTNSMVNPINYNYGVPALSYRSPFVGGYSALSHMIHKREAEADPALVYSGLTHTPFTGINSVYNTAGVINPFTYTYNTAAVNPVVYNTPAAVNPVVYNTPAVVNPVVYNAAVVKAYDHGIAATPFGAVHSSHVGKCLNNEGAEVPC